MKWADHVADPGPVALVRPVPGAPSPDAPLNVSDVLLQGDPKRTVFVVRERAFSVSEIQAMADQIADDLADADVTAGSRVLLRISDSPHLVASLLAVLSLGAIAIPTFVQYGADELRYRMRDAGVSAIVVEKSLSAEVADAIEASDAAVTVLELEMTWQDARQPRVRTTGTANTRADDLALILYTSGSTGSPKGTCHTHADLLAVCESYGRKTLKIQETDVIAGAAAIPFALGFAFFFLYPLHFGCVALLEEDKSPDRCLDLFEGHRPTLLVGVATYYSLLLRRIGDRRNVDLSSLRGCLTGGERVAESLAEGWERETGLALTQFLGTTEMLGCFIGSRLDVRVEPGAIGPAVSGYEVVVRDPRTLEAVADGTHGLLSVQGPTSTKYWRRPEKQREAVHDGWNVVPDMVYMVDGIIRFVGRQDDIIKSAGFRVAPTQVEAVLDQHPDVLECACIGAPDPEKIRPEVIKACVVLREGRAPSAELKDELQRFVKSHAPPYLYPRVVEFVANLPRTTSGKLQRSALRSRRNPETPS